MIAMIDINFHSILSHFMNRYNYYIVFFIMFLSLFNVFEKKVLLHKLIALSIFQGSIILLYLTIGFNYKSSVPLIAKDHFIDNLSEALLREAQPLGSDRYDSRFTKVRASLRRESVNIGLLYNNPLPHALMLTAIVVGLATFAVGLAIIMKINHFENKVE